MGPDDYQQAWQSQTVRTNVTIDADLLLKEVQRSQKTFRAMIFWRDFREVGISILMIPLWFILGAVIPIPWTWYLTVPVLVWTIGFTLFDRLRHPRQPDEHGAALRQCLTESLSQVEHQIWLLRNVLWWNLLPFSISFMAFLTHVAWQTSDSRLEFLGVVTLQGLGLFLLYGFVWYVNQRAVRVQLEPQRQELLTLLTSLSDEASSVDSHEIDIPICVSAFAENGFIRGAGTCMTQIRPKVRVAIGLSSLAVIAGGLAVAILKGELSWPNRTDVTSYDQPAESTGLEGNSLESLITRLRKDNELVGLAAMVMVDGEVQAAAVNGERKLGSSVPLEITDRWHLGGITNSITATMIGHLVESGQMQWSDTIGNIFPEAEVHRDWKPVTVRQLLTHTAGAPKRFSAAVQKKRPAFGAECTLARRDAVLELIADQPAHPPGTKHDYSNMGLTIAGAMAEKVTSDAWSDLVKEIVFAPLELTGAGFGPPKSSDEHLEQPRGHAALKNEKFAASDNADNTPIIGPAAMVHMTLRDLCIYATEHLNGYFREGRLLSAETYKTLHTPELNQYACGWMRRKPDTEFPHTVYWHNGSNTLWYAMVAFIPEKNMVVGVTSNDGDSSKAETAAWEIIRSRVMPAAFQAEQPADASYRKLSPFAAVRWQESEPEVKLGDEWFQLVSLDGLPASEIVAFSQRTERYRWRKRFEEDLVELLTRMGHPPTQSVTLVVQSLTSSETSVREDVPMTKANRDAIRKSAIQR